MAKQKDDTAEEVPQKPTLIKVKSTLPAKADGGFPVALYESNPDHPGGEAYVAGDQPVEVAKTSAVLKKLSDGVLEEVK